TVASTARCASPNAEVSVHFAWTTEPTAKSVHSTSTCRAVMGCLLSRARARRADVWGGSSVIPIPEDATVLEGPHPAPGSTVVLIFQDSVVLDGTRRPCGALADLRQVEPTGPAVAEDGQHRARLRTFQRRVLREPPRRLVTRRAQQRGVAQQIRDAERRQPLPPRAEEVSRAAQREIGLGDREAIPRALEHPQPLLGGLPPPVRAH